MNRTTFVIILLIIFIFIFSWLSFYTKTELKYPIVDGEFVINVGISSYNEKCVEPRDIYTYVKTSKNLIYNELHPLNNCSETTIGVLIVTSNEIEGQPIIQTDNNTLLVDINKTSDKSYLLWINLSSQEGNQNTHSIQLSTYTKNSFSNRYRINTWGNFLDKIVFEFNEKEYFCDSDCFLALTPLKSSSALGRQGTTRYKVFYPAENNFVMDFYPAKTFWIFWETIFFSITAGLILALANLSIDIYLNKNRKSDIVSTIGNVLKKEKVVRRGKNITKSIIEAKEVLLLFIASIVGAIGSKILDVIRGISPSYQFFGILWLFSVCSLLVIFAFWPQFFKIKLPEAQWINKLDINIQRLLMLLLTLLLIIIVFFIPIWFNL